MCKTTLKNTCIITIVIMCKTTLKNTCIFHHVSQGGPWLTSSKSRKNTYHAQHANLLPTYINYTMKYMQNYYEVSTHATCDRTRREAPTIILLPNSHLRYYQNTLPKHIHAQPIRHLLPTIYTSTTKHTLPTLPLTLYKIYKGSEGYSSQ